MEFNLNTIKINNKVEIKVLDLIWFIFIPIINVNYYISSMLAKNTHDITGDLDGIIKFNSIFIIPYMYWYIYVIVGFITILIKSREDYMRAFLSFFIGMSICYIIYYVYPTQINRPIINNSNIFNFLVNIIYSADKPVNCFPSLHVLTTYFIMRYTKYKSGKKNFYYTEGVGILIILSTIFVKQHFVMDAIGAIILCEMVIFIVNKIKSEKIEIILNIPYEIRDKIKYKFKGNIKSTNNKSTINKKI